MEWYFFGLIAAVLGAAAAIVMKHTLIREHALEFATILAIVNALLTAPFLTTLKINSIPLHGYALLILIALLDAIAYFLVVKATRHMPLSLSSPVLVLGPAVTAVFAFFIIGERIPAVGVFGLLLIVLGLYLLEHQPGITIRKNMRLLSRHRYVRYILIALVLYAVASTGTRYLLVPSGLDMSPTHFLGLVHIGVALFLFALLTFFYDGHKGVMHGLKEAGLPILIVGLLTVSYRYSQSVAYSMVEGKAGLVEALKRTSTLLVIAVGGSLFHEKHLPHRIFATLIIIGGVLLIII